MIERITILDTKIKELKRKITNPNTPQIVKELLSAEKALCEHEKDYILSNGTTYGEFFEPNSENIILEKERDYVLKHLSLKR